MLQHSDPFLRRRPKINSGIHIGVWCGFVFVGGGGGLSSCDWDPRLFSGVRSLEGKEGFCLSRTDLEHNRPESFQFSNS